MKNDVSISQCGGLDFEPDGFARLPQTPGRSLLVGARLASPAFVDDGKYGKRATQASPLHALADVTRTFGMVAMLLALFVAPSLALAQSPTSRPAVAPHNPTTRASKEVLEKLQTDLKTVESIEADFKQEKRLKVLKHSLKISGHFALQKPNKLVWIVDEPVKYAIKVEGDEVRQWDEDTKKVQVIHLGNDPTFKAITEQLQSWFLGDYAKLAENYDVYLEQESPLILGFTPKAGTMVASVLSHVDLNFSADGKYIDKMIIREAAGDVTTLNYIQPKINQPIAEQTWEIPPHGR